MRTPRVVTRRPAESGTAAGALALLVARALGLDAELTANLAVVLGAVPAAISFVVDKLRRVRAQDELEVEA